MDKKLLHYRVDAVRWKLFAYSRIGRIATDISYKMHERFPNSKLACKALDFCLPF